MSSKLNALLTVSHLKASMIRTRLVPIPLVNSHLNAETLRTFGNIYFSVIDAIAEDDIDFLRGSMEGKLFRYLESGISDAKAQGMKFYTNNVENRTSAENESQSKLLGTKAVT